MTKPRRSPNRAIIAATAAGALLIGGAVVALADPPSEPVVSGPNGPVSNASPGFKITDGDALNGTGTFLWAFDGVPSEGPVADGTTVTPASPLSQGAHTFQAREVGTPPDADGAIKTQSFFVDTVNPTFTRVVSPAAPNGLAGWYTGTVTVDYTCADPGGANASGLTAPCPTDLALNTGVEDGVYVLATGPVTDLAGNTSGASLPALTVSRDSTPPAKPNLTGPLQITNVLSPVLSWSQVDDVTPQGVLQTSGFKHYVLTIRQGASGGSIVHQANVNQPPAPGEVTYNTVPPLTNGTTYNWTVQAVDNAGNTNTSALGVFKVDTTAPDDPTFSAGPVNGAATNDNTPTFTFAGVDGATFTWETRNNLDQIVPGAGFSGTGAQTSVTLPTLPDGSYTFKVKQTAPNLKDSGFATALFTVDTTAPAAPSITSSPGTTTNPQPSFGWNAAEQDGTFVWEVTGVGGVRVQGPGESSTAAVSLTAPLSAGNYAFRVRQRDRAGNLSDWSAGEPFTIVNPSEPGGGNNGGGTTSGFKPNTRNAKALLPKVGTKVRPTATVLRWKKTKGATLYNLQIFRIDGTTYRKVHSAFPRGLKYKVPKKVLKSGRRYVWRVWPYLGAKRKYTPAPFGISWFDAK
ncbi:MAG: hypothetical protein U0237_02310 [Thermoleophilia bacterium]